MGLNEYYDGDEVSSIADKGELGYIDFANDTSIGSYNTNSEGPVIISVPFPFISKQPQSILFGDTLSEKITIQNTTNRPVDLWKVEIYDSTPKDSFTVSIMEPPSKYSDEDYVRSFYDTLCLEDRVLQPEQVLTVWLTCKPKETGLHTTAVHFDVGDKVIERLVFILVDDNVSRSMVSNKPYCRDRKKQQLVIDTSARHMYVPSVRPIKGVNRGHRYQLNSYPIMKEVREAVKRKNMMPSGITKDLTKENYSFFFSTLLNMEEITLEDEMRGYDMEKVSFGRKRFYLTLEVPGLAEKRPSLVYGDFVFAKLASDDVFNATRPYQGFIHRVEAEVVYLQFDKDFHSAHAFTNLYNVQFNYNRVNMRKLYQAIEATNQVDADFLFPCSSYSRQIKPTQLGPFSNMLNEEQKLAIKMIIGCRSSTPYIILGPPGTGKTMTIIEAIIQLYKERKDTRILVCAPSNSAADNLLEMLLKRLGNYEYIDDILRLNAFTRPVDEIKPEYLRFSYFNESSFACPNLWEFKRFRIIISTYMSCFYMHAEGVRHGHFSHIFLDEAGQASVPETMVPLSNFCKRDTVIVLAGDPCQLGPVVHSKNAENSGLSISFLERLYSFEFYKKGSKNYVSKLVRNYRSHPEILSLPSRLFYNDELIAMKKEDVSSLKWVEMLPNKESSVLFMGIQGCDEREGNNPSWFNRIEASKVVSVVRELIEEKGLNEEDIGVITPYRQQVLKVYKILASLGCSGVKVGSVEQFQGQERKVIIISTVRSTVKHNKFDEMHYLGFLSNWRRFNVAVTRAMSLLIVIGNPHILGKDKYWNMLLRHCVENGSYQGCPLPQNKSFVKCFTRKEGDTEYRDDGWDDSPTNNVGRDNSSNIAIGWGDSSYDENIPQDYKGKAKVWE